MFPCKFPWLRSFIQEITEQCSSAESVLGILNEQNESSRRAWWGQKVKDPHSSPWNYQQWKEQWREGGEAIGLRRYKLIQRWQFQLWETCDTQALLHPLTSWALKNLHTCIIKLQIRIIERWQKVKSLNTGCKAGIKSTLTKSVIIQLVSSVTLFTCLFFFFLIYAEDGTQDLAYAKYLLYH